MNDLEDWATVTTPHSPDPPDAGRPSRAELDRQVRDRIANWRDQPRGLACAVIGGFMILTTAAFVFAVAAVVSAMS
ncbi:hypothetical protein FHX41_1086 [Actinomadura hallensis]|uniref:Uncharacterized protein n=1 Tax=Actinomadura hallensis TaxID=337895 RepID=A0A543IA62_9ACTN|nr:hypothetical protein [Actinomadura hallensis]TQM67472.1 hypothetical protein FHX41_1086 [Actinomadura hallensis]HLV76055.1 hypothetical protein [Vulgatibacteraceae bacterium]